MAAVDASGQPLEEITQEDVIVDMLRQLKKAAETLVHVDNMMGHEAQMNSAKHLSGELLPNPLAAKVRTTLSDIERSVDRYEGAGDAAH